MFFQERRHSRIDAVINTLHIDVENPVPGIFFHHAHEAEPHNSCIADEHIHRRDLSESRLHCVAVCHIAADGRCAGLFRHGTGRIMAFFIEEVNLMALCGKKFHRRSANTTAAAGDYDG